MFRFGRHDSRFGMFRFGRRDNPHGLVVGMAGVKMGDRLIQVGCAEGSRLAAIASKVGLSGRACAVVPDAASADRARKGAARAGVLVDVEVAAPSRLPLDDAAFDLAVVDDTASLLATMTVTDRSGAIHELLRVLRPGGRVMVVGTGRRGGIGGLLAQRPPVAFDVIPGLEAGGFKSVRMLAEREGLTFVEGVKPRT